MEHYHKSIRSWDLTIPPIANESIIPISTIGQQIDQISKTAMELLILQMNEMKKRQPVPLSEPIHKQITPVLIRRNTTD